MPVKKPNTTFCTEKYLDVSGGEKGDAAVCSAAAPGNIASAGRMVHMHGAEGRSVLSPGFTIDGPLPVYAHAVVCLSIKQPGLDHCT